MPAIGETISHYRILQALGAGGMGEVYLAEDTTLHRKVALKFPQIAGNAPAQATKRFLREARAAAKLQHASIVHVYEAGEVEGKPFIAMEYLEGQTLAERISGGPAETSDVIRIGIDVADALEEAHRHGIIHRDIKPSNIIVTRHNQVKVVDFGLAKINTELALSADDSTEYRTAEGATVGTLHYMSPEQALGRQVDQRSDLFSLGEVLYELITARRPFSAATTAETIDRILHGQAEAIGRFNVEAPPELERIIRKCLEKEPERRYQSARDLVADLRNLQRDLQQPASLERPTSFRPVTARGALVILTLLLVGAGATLLWRQRRQQPIDSVAVLPFTNTRGDASTEFLSDGMTENLIYQLSTVSHLRVVPRSTVFRYKGSQSIPQVIGRDLNVRAVLLGRVMQQGDKLRVSAELVDIGNEAQLWGAQYDRTISEVQNVENDIATAVATRLRVSLTDSEQRDLNRQFTRSGDAHLLYLKGRYFWNKRSKEGIEKGIDCFRQAIDADPAYSLAYVGLADSYNFLGALGIAAVPPPDAMPKARAAALKALEIDDSLAAAHASLGFVKFYYDWDWAAAEREFRRAIELNHDYAQAHQWYAHLLMARGRKAEAVGAAKQAVELDPLSLAANMSVGWLYDWAGEPALAIQHLQKTLELDPNFAQARWSLGLAYQQRGMFDRALVELQRAVELTEDDAVYLASLGYTNAVAGKISDAVRIRDSLNGRASHSYVSPYWMAVLCAGLGSADDAFQWLEKAYEERSGGLVWLRLDPRLQAIRSDPRFAALMARVESSPRHQD